LRGVFATISPFALDVFSPEDHIKGPMRFPLLALILPGALAAAQSAKTIEIAGTPKCANCGVRLEEITALGDLSQGPNKLDPGAYAVDKKRNLVYTRGSSRTEINAWDMTGKVQFTVGLRERRPPKNPMEQSFALGPGDSLWVLEPMTQHVTIYAPGTGTSVRAFAAKTKIERIIPLRDGRFVGITSRADPKDKDKALVHVFSGDGTESTPILAQASPGSRPVVALSKNGSTIWIARPDGFVIDGWSLDGKQTTTLKRASDWFTADAMAKAKKANRTPPRVVDLYEGEDGLVWVAAVKPDPTYKPATKKGAPPAPDVVNVLEVLNPSAARVEFADEISAPLYRTGGEYLVQPDLKGALATWRVVKAKFVKR